MTSGRTITGALVGLVFPALASVGFTQEAIPHAEPLLPVANVVSYFVQFRCPDGSTDPHACIPQPQNGAMAVKWRRADWGSNGVLYYQISDSFLADDRNSIVQTWSYSPWGPFVQANGDGGQVGYTDNVIARFNLTQDGGTSRKQYFVGPACGGQGWQLFDLRQGVQTGSWMGAVYNLSIASDPSQCPPLGQAWTQWRIERVFYPFIADGQRTTRGIPTIIVEHYDHADIASSVYMERAYFARLYGWLRWEAWESGSGQRPVSSDLAQRCPTVTIPNVADGSSYWASTLGWQLYDCRHSTQIVPVLGWTADRFGWPG